MPRFEEHHRIGAAIWGLLDVLFCEVDGDNAAMQERHPPCLCPYCGAAKDALDALDDLKKLREERDEARKEADKLSGDLRSMRGMRDRYREKWRRYVDGEEG